jgi:hypothetical protein
MLQTGGIALLLLFLCPPLLLLLLFYKGIDTSAVLQNAPEIAQRTFVPGQKTVRGQRV